MDVLREEAEEDFAKMAAIIPSEREYLKTSAFSIYKARIPWLLILMISATFSSAILGFFEASLIPVLVLFVPMLMDTGGNSGSQASVTAIRGLSTGEVKPRDVLKILSKEIIVGLMLGVTLGAIAFVKIILVDRLLLSNEAVTIAVAFAVTISLALTVIASKIIGTSLPFLAKRVGVDPAVMASPFITTVVDALSLVIYFGFATMLLGI
jgi:magnesium transporter